MLNDTGPGEAQDGGELEELAAVAALPEPGARTDLASLAQAAGVSPETVRKARRAGQSGQRAEAAFRAARVRALSVGLAPQAMQTLAELMQPGVPPAVRLQAAKWVLEVSGHRPGGPAEAQGKGLEDMSSDELAATIARLDATIAARADAATPARKVILQDSADAGPDAGG